MLDRLLDRAVKAATEGQGVGPRNCYRVGAVLFDKKGRIINAKSNSYKSHPKLLPFTKWPFLHAESSCIIANGIDRSAGLSLLVTRITKSGDVSMAAPCPCCHSLLQYSGLKEVYYTDWKGNIQCKQIS